MQQRRAQEGQDGTPSPRQGSSPPAASAATRLCLQLPGHPSGGPLHRKPSHGRGRPHSRVPQPHSSTWKVPMLCKLISSALKVCQALKSLLNSHRTQLGSAHGIQSERWEADVSFRGQPGSGPECSTGSDNVTSMEWGVAKRRGGFVQVWRLTLQNCFIFNQIPGNSIVPRFYSMIWWAGVKGDIRTHPRWSGAPLWGQTSCRHCTLPLLSLKSTTFSPNISTPTGLSPTFSDSAERHIKHVF